jgi:hypothetical protein
MRKFGIYETEDLPVVENEESNKLMGRVSRRDIMNVYNREILRQGSLGLKFVRGKLPEKSSAQSYVDLPDGFEISVISAPSAMLEHAFKDLDLRHKYEVTVVSINRRGESGQREVVIPNPDDELRKGDMLVVMGKVEALRNLKEAFDLPG